MEPPVIAGIARNFAAMARIRGPDPKAVKMRRHAFHLHQSGVTTLSASAIVLPLGSLNEPPPFLDHVRAVHEFTGNLALTVASLVEPFLVAEQRNSAAEELHPRLIPDAHIDLLVEGEKLENHGDGKSGAARWLSSRLLALVDIPASSASVLSLLQHDGASVENLSWDVGWSLAHLNQKQVESDVRPSFESHRNRAIDESIDPSHLANLATRIAILGIPILETENARNIDVSPMQQRGDCLLAIGSPFCILSPFHFFNSISVGAVANCLPPGSLMSSLLIADIRCLPGMEGAPVFDRHSRLVGMLIRPLRQRSSSTEIQLVITWNAIATAWGGNRLHNGTLRPPGELLDRTNTDSKPKELLSSDKYRTSFCDSAEGLYSCSVLPSVKKALSSVVLVTVGDASWGSGIVLNNRGLILTNAHLLEPWRFGRTSLGLNTITSFCVKENACKEENRVLFPLPCRVSDCEEATKHQRSLFNFGYKRDRRLSIRLDHGEKQMWCNATVVHISKGALDVALLQMETIPVELCPINPEFVCPSAGASVYVVGHGLLGPRSGLYPSLFSGVVSNIVKIPVTHHSSEAGIMYTENRAMPVMLQTTAAVHPGASGGALINSDGRMIGLITSNARHGGGNTIPYLNFSIPCKSLEQIFQYSEEGNISILEKLDKPNEPLSSVWALTLAPSPFLDYPPGMRSNEKKVSRFSKFLAEKQQEFKSHKDLQLLLRHKLPGKI